jgi:peroxiredoxin Q/BCP
VSTKKKSPPKKKPAPRAKAAKKPAPKKKTAAKKPAPKKKPAATKAATKKPALDLPVTAAPAAGTAAPAFNLASSAGGTLALADLLGKHVVLYFYPKDDTPGCTIEACGFRDQLGELTKKGAVVLGVSRDSIAAHQKFKAKHQLPFELLSDPDGKVISAYGSWGPKSFMGRNFLGIKRTTVLIDPEGKIKKVYPKVSPKTHAAEILADLG